MTLAGVEPDRIRVAIEKARDAGDLRALEAFRAALQEATKWRPQAHQVAPPGNWWAWVMLAGRGSGKTDAGAYWFNQHMMGPPCDSRVPGGHYGSIVAPTLADAVKATYRGPSSIRVHNPEVRLTNRKDGSYLIWPNGAEASIYGAHSEDDADRLRAGGNSCVWWVDEAAAARHLKLALDNIAFGARLGTHAQGCITTTPKNRPEVRAWLTDSQIVVTRASTYDNPFLPESLRQRILRYEGTRLGRQEIHGQVLDDYEGALWQRERIDDLRVPVPHGPPADILDALGIVRVAVGIDPSTWSPELGGTDDGSTGEGIETGIVVVGVDAQPEPHVYVLEDCSGRFTAEEWARAACDAYHRWGAAFLVPETNMGGAMVLATIRLTDRNVAIYRDGKRVGVRASQGKRARAEPVALLDEQGRAHHVGTHAVLEDVLCGWDPTEPWSPDRMDAYVWAVTALNPVQHVETGTSVAQMAQARIPLRR